MSKIKYHGVGKEKRKLVRKALESGDWICERYARTHLDIINLAKDIKAVYDSKEYDEEQVSNANPYNPFASEFKPWQGTRKAFRLKKFRNN